MVLPVGSGTGRALRRLDVTCGHVALVVAERRKNLSLACKKVVATATSTDADGPVLFELLDGVATITLNRPENRNSMTAEVLKAFSACVDRCCRDPEVRCVVIAGSGSTFCGGADFGNFSGGASADGTAAAGVSWETLRYEVYGPFLSLLDLKVPVIAAMNGHAVGGGLGLALVCDMRVGSDNARYGANFARLGLHPGMATTYLLPRLVGTPRAAELLFTGRLITGAEAERIGLLNYTVPQQEVLAKAAQLAREIAANAPLAVRWTKQSLLQNTLFDPRPAALLEAHMQSRSFETNDAKEGIKALLEKRPPRFGRH